MECSKCTTWLSNNQQYGVFILRIIIGLIFVTAGYAKLFKLGPSAVAGMLSGWPVPLAFAWILALTEFIGGILLLLGLWTRWASMPLAFVMIVATTMHLFVFTGAMGGFMAAQLAIVVLAGTLALMFNGAGALALDNIVCKNHDMKKR